MQLSRCVNLNLYLTFTHFYSNYLPTFECLCNISEYLSFFTQDAPPVRLMVSSASHLSLPSCDALEAQPQWSNHLHFPHSLSLTQITQMYLVSPRSPSVHKVTSFSLEMGDVTVMVQTHRWGRRITIRLRFVPSNSLLKM